MTDAAPPLPRGLYAITPESLQGDALSEAVAQALAGGAALIQYRAKQRPPAQRLEEARRLRKLCADRGAGLIINDDVELAGTVDADGVHLGRDDSAAAHARQRLGARAWIGVSCYDDLALARAAQEAGADYVAFGSFFPSLVKPRAVRAPVELLRRARQYLSLPVCAIGGITPANGAALVADGAHLLAVITGVFGADDIRAAAQAYARLFPGARQAPGQT